MAVGRSVRARIPGLRGSAPPDDAASLGSRSVGLPSSTLITSCKKGPGSPDPKAADPPFALAFSGGGFRASLAAAGVLRFAADAEILGRVRYVSSVSGGSITHGLFAAAYEELEQSGFAPEEVDKLVVDRLIHEVSDSSFQLQIARNVLWRAVLGETRADVLADMLAHRFFGKVTLGGLPTTCRFVFNASNLSTGVRFTLEPKRVGDYVIGWVDTAARKGDPLRLAEAVAASAAFPGAFSPFYLDGYDFPCRRGEQPLVDGGAYDNLGLEALRNLMPPICLIALNAGGLFHTGFAGVFPVVGDLKRVNALLYRQSTSLRSRLIVERFKAYEALKPGDPIPSFARRGVFFNLATTLTPTPDWEHGRPHGGETQILHLANLKTSFAKFSQENCRALVYRGWWLAGATLSKHHRGLLPRSLPSWRPL